MIFNFERRRQPVQKGAEYPWEVRCGADHLGELVKYEKQWVILRLAGDMLKRLVPVPVGDPSGVANAGPGDGRRPSRQHAKLPLLRTPGTGVGQHADAGGFGEALDKRRLADPPPPPDQSRTGVTLPPFGQSAQLTSPVDELRHKTNVSRMLPIM